jgi:hypothetical protein
LATTPLSEHPSQKPAPMSKRILRIEIASSTIVTLAGELKLELPGETAQPDDNIGEAEYLRRADGMTAEASAGVALEISGERKVKEDQAATQGARPPQARCMRSLTSIPIPR